MCFDADAALDVMAVGCKGSETLMVVFSVPFGGERMKTLGKKHFPAFESACVAADGSWDRPVETTAMTTLPRSGPP